jgi:hypothetical protein
MKHLCVSLSFVAALSGLVGSAQAAPRSLSPDQCDPTQTWVLDPKLVMGAPCTEDTFGTKETRIDGIGIDKDDSFKFLRNLKEAQKKIQIGLAVLAIPGGPEGFSESKRKNGFELGIVPMEKIQCCNNEVVTRRGVKAKVDLYAEAQQRLFYGVPYIGELGIRAEERAGLKYEFSIGTECAGLQYHGNGRRSHR